MALKVSVTAKGLKSAAQSERHIGPKINTFLAVNWSLFDDKQQKRRKTQDQQ